VKLRVLTPTLLLALLAGCAGPRLPPAVFDGSAADALGAGRPAAIEADPYALDDADRRWLRGQVDTEAAPETRLLALVELFGAGGPLELVYDLAVTTDARGTLAARQGNCLAFTVLFVALARDLGLEAQVQEIAIPAAFSRMQEVVVANRHVVARGRLPGRVWEVDFGQFVRPEGTPERLLSDREVAAAVASNQGAAALAVGADARGLLRSALATDPGLVQGWINLGVALARDDELSGAEFAFRRALELGPGESSALAGLLRLYQAHAPATADELEARLPALRAQNPYNVYFRGLAQERAGDLQGAAESFRHALRLNEQEPWFHLALVRNRVAAGRPEAAHGALVRARSRLGDGDQFALLVAELSAGEAPEAPPSSALLAKKKSARGAGP
jgi:tetratricopeptide (TPR) repeat protein